MTQSASTNLDVFVVGAGPVGMCVASELTRYGVRCRIIDKKPEPVEHSHASVVHVRTQEVLEAMGIVAGWKINGFPFEQVVMRAFGKRLGALQLGGVDSPHPSPLTIGQNVTEWLLLDRLANIGVRVERPVEAIDFSQDTDGVSVTLRHADGSQEIARASWVISCEGSGSMVRQKLGVLFEGERNEKHEFLQADARVRWLYPTGRGYAFVNKDRFLGFFPFSADGSYRILCARPDMNPADREPPTLEEMQQIVREMADPDAELYEPKWLNRFRTQHRIATRFRDGRAFLAGDAGHVHVPVAGQGMNTGIQDAFNLAWKLASVIRGVARPEILDSYNTERHPVAEGLLKGTDQGFHALVQPNDLIALALQFLGPVAINLEPLQSFLRTTVAEIGIAYQDSPIAQDWGGSNGPTAGERAPDANIVKLSNKKTIRLFEVLQGTHWTLLLFSGYETSSEIYQGLKQIGETTSSRYSQVIATHLVIADAVLPAQLNWNGSILIDSEHELHDKYGVSSACLYLVRPDWYVGFRSPSSDSNRLLAYLNDIFTL